MPTETTWLRAAYPVWGRLPRRKPGWHAVSESVPVEIRTLVPAEAPVALTVSRPMHHRALSDAERWNRLRLGDGPRRRQTLELRLVDDRLMTPVMGPDGVTPMDVDGLARLEEVVRGSRSRQANQSSRCVTWDAYPCTSPTNFWDPEVKGAPWPDADARHVHRPVWDCPDLGDARFAEVDEASREVALGRFRERATSLALIEGGLWTTCGIPVIVTNLAGPKGTRLALPSSDPFPRSPAPGQVAVLALDHRAAMPDGMTLSDLNVTVETHLEVPRADHARANLVALRQHARLTLKEVTVEAMPTPFASLVGWAHEASDRVKAGEDATALEEETCRRMRAALDDPRTAKARHDAVTRFAQTMRCWPDLVEAERAAIVDARMAAEVDLDALALGM